MLCQTCLLTYMFYMRMCVCIVKFYKCLANYFFLFLLLIFPLYFLGEKSSFVCGVYWWTSYLFMVGVLSWWFSLSCVAISVDEKGTAVLTDDDFGRPAFDSYF